MKKVIAMLLVATMTFSLVACGNNAGTSDGGNAPAQDAGDTTGGAEAEAPATEEPAAEEPAASGTDDVNVLPREETLYFAGQQWGAVNSWNIMGTNQNNAMAIAGGPSGYRTIMFETLYMYNFMNGEMTGLLANDDWAWNDDMTQVTLTIKDAAKWSDGTPVTAEDVKRLR